MNIICKLGFHKWVTMFHEGIHTYYECNKCKIRKVKCNVTGLHNPIDHDWIKHESIINRSI